MGVPAGPGVSASGRSPYFPLDKANAVVQGTLAAVAPTKPFGFYGPMNLSIWADFTTSLTLTAASLTGVVGAAGLLAAGASISTTLLPGGVTMSALGGTNATLVLPPLTYYGFVTSGIAQVRDLLDTTFLSGATVSGLGVVSSQTVTAIPTASVAPSPSNPMGRRGVVTLSAVATAEQDLNTVPSPYEFTLAAAAVPTGVDAAAVFTSAAIGLTATVQLERSFDGGLTWLLCNIGSSGALAQWSGTPLTPVNLSFGEPEAGVLYRLNCVALTPSTGLALRYRISETGQAARSLSVPTL